MSNKYVYKLVKNTKNKKFSTVINNVWECAAAFEIKEIHGMLCIIMHRDFNKLWKTVSIN